MRLYNVVKFTICHYLTSTFWQNIYIIAQCRSFIQDFAAFLIQVFPARFTGPLLMETQKSTCTFIHNPTFIFKA